MISIDVRAPELQRLQRAYEKRGKNFTRDVLMGIAVSLEGYAEAGAKERAPFGASNSATGHRAGTLQKSITTSLDVRGSGAKTVVVGRVFPGPLSENYATVMELGRSPNRTPPPYRALLGWVRAKLGVPTKEVRSAAIALARSIGKKGIEGRHFFRDAAKSTRKQVRPTMRRVIREWLRKNKG